MTQEATLEAFKPWVRTVARSYAQGDPDLTEEYAQEAWIAIWRTLEKKPGSPDVHLKADARQRLKDCYIRGDRLGKPRAGHSTKIATVPVDGDAPLWESLTSLPGGSEMAYHTAEIVEAINGLSPAKREYVYLRFWKGYDSPTLTRHFGYDPVSLWSRPKTGAKAILKSRLDHLAVVA